MSAADGDNFAPLASLAWQLHVHRAAGEDLAAAADDSGIALHESTWSDRAGRAEFRRGTAYLVRPDGDIGLTMRKPDDGRLRAYLAEQRRVPAARAADRIPS